MSHVFLSYSRMDSEMVDDIVARLTRDGLDVWLDRKDIKGGDLWREEIVEAVDQAYAFVLMLSPNSLASENVRKEVDVADGSSIEMIPAMLLPVSVPARLRYQLAGIQWIEYYRDPEAKYAELVHVLRNHQRNAKLAETSGTRQVELVISRINISKFGVEEQEKLLNFISQLTSTPRTDLKLTAVTAGSVHAFVNMPATAAYQLKTAVLNKDLRLSSFGIDALRLSGDKKYVFVKTGSIASLKAGRSLGPWLIGGLLFITLLLLASTWYSFRAPPSKPVITDTPSATNTFSSTATNTVTATPSDTPIPSITATLTPSITATLTLSITAKSTDTFTPIPTDTFTATNPPPPLSAPRPVSPRANETFYSFTGCKNVMFSWRPVSEPDVVYTLHVQTDQGSDVATSPGIRGMSTTLELCTGGYQWQVASARTSDGQMGLWSNWIPFQVRRSIPTLNLPPTLIPIPIPN